MAAPPRDISISRFALGFAGLFLVCGTLAVLGGDGKLPISAPLRQWLIAGDWSSAGVVEWQAQEATASFDDADQRRAAEIYRSLVRRDPANPYRWCDLAEALQAVGGLDEAGKAFRQARILGPAIPPVLIRAANFYFSTQDTAAATEAYAKVLALTHEYDPIIFLTLRRLGLQVGDVIARVLPKDPESAKNYFVSVMNTGDIAGGAMVWGWLIENGLSSEKLAEQYVDFLLRHDKGQTATAAWGEYVGKRRGDYLEPNLIYNGRFGSDPSGSRLDWHIEAVDGAETEIVTQDQPRNGRILEIRFGGQTNVNYHHVWQALWIPAGSYRVSAHVSSDHLTTNQGVQLHLTDSTHHRFDWMSDPVLGTNERFWLEGNITVPDCPFLLLEIVRQPSEKFDNKINGTVQFESISIVKSL